MRECVVRAGSGPGRGGVGQRGNAAPHEIGGPGEGAGNSTLVSESVQPQPEGDRVGAGGGAGRATGDDAVGQDTGEDPWGFRAEAGQVVGDDGFRSPPNMAR